MSNHARNNRSLGTVRPATAALLALLLLAVAAPASIAAALPDKQDLYSFETGDQITGGFSMTSRNEDGITTRVRTAATPGHAVTVWYVVFNNPEACLDGACSGFDLFIDGDMANGFNLDQINATRASVVYGGDGDVVNAGGRLALDASLGVGEVPTGSVPVAIGDPADGALVPGPVTGLEDAQTAEVHVVVQDHGQAQTDAALLESQLSGFMTECNPACVDVQFAIHLP
jgi:hypothetical protein